MPSPETSSCLVVFSGGQDSTTCLYWAKKKFAQVCAVTFDYGQRHRVELEAASKICQLAKVSQTVLPVDTFRALGGNTLTDPVRTPAGMGPGNLPDTFVPGRNLVFLTFAAALAWQKGISDLVTGVCQTDYSGYPDCRENTMRALEDSISLGMDRHFRIHTPLMFLTKKESVLLACGLGALDALAWSHTCYNGEFPPCGHCPACLLRAKGFAEAGVPDPLVERARTE
ncbi:MAG TPA: 7-cyano-7-deazaguanine synthase QueC [Fibrobacteraceae bacterium]|nr:7-cyano-7-deazaguanine synthase QueC [Fibrobacteraceae bacterium]